jgi:2-dehydro-3-deoxygluconokinase
MMIRNTESEGEDFPAATVVTLGEAMLRLASPTGLRLADAPALDVHVAGAEANVAAALAALGVTVRWASRLPDDALGRRVATALAASGVLVDAVAWAPGERLGLFFSDTGVAPRPTVVTYDRAGSAFTRMEALPAGALAGARRLHLTGITPAVAPPGLVAGVLAQARQAGVPVSVDVNFRSLLWTPDAARDGIAPLLAAAETVICGEADARAVFGLEGGPEAIVAALRATWAPAARHVVLTRGDAGCVAAGPDGAWHERAAVPATVVDRFGMGDAFAAGLLWSLLEGDDLGPALDAAVTLAALKGTVAGDLSRASADELRAALAHDPREMLR